MITKGFIIYKTGKLPFVMKDYKLELFTEDPLLEDFIKEYNFKTNYILTGQYFRMGTTPENITLLVDRTMGNTCYITCFVLERLRHDTGFDCINFQSRTLDSIFKYRYNYIDLSRAGVNLSSGEREIYNIPFNVQDQTYELIYKIGQKTDLGLLEDFSSWGIASIILKECNIQECYKLSVLIERFSKFMIDHSCAPFKKITLTQKGFPVGWFYYNNISGDPIGDYDGLFQDFDVNQYTSKILTNLGSDPNYKISTSIPLGHLSNYENTFSPQRFVEQVMAFEYLYQKLYPAKNRLYLITKLEEMFTTYSVILRDQKTPHKISDEIRQLRKNIAHGYEYYYTFDNDRTAMFNICKLDTLIKFMSLSVIGFSDQEIQNYKPILY